MNKVIFVTTSMPHYRRGLIEQLNKDSTVDYFFASGYDKNDSIKKLVFFDDVRHFLLKNLWLNKFFVIQFGLLRIIREVKPSAVVFTGDWKILSTWFYLIFCRVLNVKTYFWSHGILSERRTINNSIKYIFFNSFSNGGFLYSERAKKILLEKKYRKKLIVIYNSLDYKSQNKIANSQNSGGNSRYPHLVFIGRITIDRQLDLLVDALNLIDDKRIKVYLIGAGAYLSDLKKKILEYNISDQFIFVGPLYTEEEIYPYFRDARACVFPGSIGLSIVHSFTYGVPVITHNNTDSQKPESEALTDGENGFLYQYNSFEDLARVINKIYLLDDDKYSEMKIRAKSVVTEYY